VSYAAAIAYACERKKEQRSSTMFGTRIYSRADTLQSCSGRPTANGFNFSLYSLSRRGCPIKFIRVSCGGVLFNTTHLLILVAALKSRFTNSMRFLPLVEFSNARIPRTRGLNATIFSLPHRLVNIISRPLPHFVFFFVTCSSSRNGRQYKDFSSFLFRQYAMTGLRDPQLSCSYLFS